MSFEPEKFFIGVIDFFSILLPGAILAYFLKSRIFLKGFVESLGDAEQWIVFLFCSYLLGHVAYALGSYFLDDLLFDPIRKSTYGRQIDNLADGKKLRKLWWRRLASCLFEDRPDQTVNVARKIKEAAVTPLAASNAVNAFQWAKAVLLLEQPAASASVQRIEADSKFFRSLAVVLVVVGVLTLGARVWTFFTGVVTVPWWTPISCLLLLPLSLWRYKDLRVKAIDQAYYHIIAIESRRKEPVAWRSPWPTHAGGVVYRGKGESREYLLVNAKDDPQQWVLPKGHIEPGERTEETAVREVREETGVWARLERRLDVISFTSPKGEPVHAQFYLMSFVEDDTVGSGDNRRGLRQFLPWLHPKVDEERRPTKWVSITEALAVAEKQEHAQTEQLLQLVKKLPPAKK